jgi:hypothetical protein
VIFGGTWLASLPGGLGRPCGVGLSLSVLDVSHCVLLVGSLSAWLLMLSR